MPVSYDGGSVSSSGDAQAADGEVRDVGGGDAPVDASGDGPGDAGSDSALDAPFDGPLDAGNDSGLDASHDAPADAPADAPNVLGAPRPIAPLSTATATSQTPRFRWVLASGEDGAEVEIYRDRACTVPVASFTAAGTSGAPPGALAAGVYFWRLRGVASGVVGTDTSPVWELFVGARSAPVDSSFGTVLDIDGDGFADVLNSTYLYLGGVAGPATPGTHLLFQGTAPTSVASAGDIDGDGFPEIVQGAGGLFGLYMGGPGGASLPPIIFHDPGPTTDPVFGKVVASAGDVNGDGYADVIVSSELAGVAFVYHGGPTGLGATPEVLHQTVTGFGHFVAGAGDVNGDGIGDVVIGGSPGVFLYLGGAQGLTGPAISVPDGYGENPVACAGDVDGDGYADIVAGGTSGAFGGLAVVTFGGPGGISSVSSTLFPRAGGTDLYDSVAGGGDVDGDGFADVLVSSIHDDVVYGYTGGPGWVSEFPTWQTSQANYYGRSVAGAGDVNGDGYGDVVAEADSTTTYVFLGAAGGLPSTPSFTLAGGYTVAVSRR